MATTNFYLDRRNCKSGKPGTMKVMLRLNDSTSSISTGVRLHPDEWDGWHVTNRPDAKELDAKLLKMKADIDLAVLAICSRDAEMPATAAELRDCILKHLYPYTTQRPKRARFLPFYESIMDSKEDGTRYTYLCALRKMKAYDDKLGARTFDDMGKKWFDGFITYMSQTMSKNGMVNYLRNIRTVFNAARKSKLTDNYPFSEIDMRSDTSDPYALSLDEVRTIATMPLEPWQEEYRDMFMLMFYINGIRPVDLLTAKAEQIKDGRFMFTPKKTRNTSGIKLSVKLEPEVLALIEKHKGTNWLLSPLDRYADYADYLKHMNRALRTFGLKYEEGRKPTGKALFPHLSAYWARHSWATLALNEFGYSVDVVGQALGHKDNMHKITWIYIKPDYRRVDEASRTLIDAVTGKEEKKAEPSDSFGQFCYTYSY